MIYKCETTYNGGKDLDGLFFDDGKGILIAEKEFNAEKINLEFPDGSNRENWRKVFDSRKNDLGNAENIFIGTYIDETGKITGIGK